MRPDTANAQGAVQASNDRRNPLCKKLRRVAEVVHELQKELHWDAYRDRHPEAAQAALPALYSIVDEELTQYVRRRRIPRASGLEGSH
jgi:hypothetical protein